MKINNLSAPRLHSNVYPLPPGRRQLNIIGHRSRIYLCALSCLFAPLLNAGTTKALSSNSSEPLQIGNSQEKGGQEGQGDTETFSLSASYSSSSFASRRDESPLYKTILPSLKATEQDAANFVTAQIPPIAPPPPQDITPPSTPNQPPTPELLPPADQLLTPTNNTPKPSTEVPSSSVTGKILVERFEVEGSTVFSPKQLAEVLKPFTNRRLTFAELIQARSLITQLYIDHGYTTSGALIPPQSLTGGVVKIQVVEGELENINVTGLSRLNSNYVRSRIAVATKKPVNVPRLLDALRVLQLDPLIKNLSAELSAGSGPGLNILDLQVKEADTFNAQITLDNGRSPSVGTFRRRAQITQANLLGLGDGLTVGYTNTDGSNGLDVSYTLPVNARNGTLNLAYGTTSSNVIEAPFNKLDIISDSRYYELTFRQPVIQTPSQEFAVGIAGSRRESETSLLDTPYPLSQGADDQGRTRISAVRFFQEWTKRSSRQVIAARSQFTFGIDAFNATINQNAPDSNFFSWRGQGQWVRLLAPDTLFLVRGDVQLADRALVPTEQFGLGGLGSVRGYRQDSLLTDNGALLTAELRLPILKKSQTLLQVVPFVDVGTAWNSRARDTPETNTLAAVGLGLQFSQGSSFTARLDWGIPLVSVDSRESTWQENGLYFSIAASAF
jgi:hemolysin activation/secretion protein